MRTIVGGMLPQEFLLDLGTYMQTAAHIELAAWQVAMHAEGIDPDSEVAFHDFVNTKLSTDALLKRFRGSADGCPAWIAARIRETAERLKEGLETRNLAAHGAFFVENGELHAAHYFRRGKGKDRQLFEVKEPVQRQVVKETLEVADQLLHDLIALRAMVYEWRFPDGLPWEDQLTKADTLSHSQDDSESRQVSRKSLEISAYSAFLNGGYRSECSCIGEIFDTSHPVFAPDSRR